VKHTELQIVFNSANKRQQGNKHRGITWSSGAYRVRELSGPEGLWAGPETGGAGPISVTMRRSELISSADCF